jgi:hypothetical protein
MQEKLENVFITKKLCLLTLVNNLTVKKSNRLYLVTIWKDLSVVETFMIADILF